MFASGLFTTECTNCARKEATRRFSLPLILGLAAALIISLLSPKTALALPPTPGSQPSPIDGGGEYKVYLPLSLANADPNQVASMAQDASSRDVCGTNVWVDPQGNSIEVTGTINGTSMSSYTSIAQLSLPDNKTAYAYCTDFHHGLNSNERVCLDGAFFSDWRVAWLVTNYPPVVNNYTENGVTHNANIEQAARQAAVWHFTDDFYLTGASANSTQVMDTYNQILASIPAVIPAEYQTGNIELTIEPNSDTNFLPGQPDHNFVIHLTKGGRALSGQTVTVNATQINGRNVTLALVSPSTEWKTDANGEIHAKVTTSRTGNSYNSGTTTLTATATITMPAGSRFVHQTSPDTNQRLVLGQTQTLTASTTAVKSWVNSNNVVIAHKFNDKNFNGIQDEDEPNIEGWTFTLTLPNNSTYTANTDSKGNAYFTECGRHWDWSTLRYVSDPCVSANGTYKLNETLQSGWVNSTTVERTRARSSSDAWAQWYETFGNAQKAVVTVNKYHDVNVNSQKDTGEEPLANWQFALYGLGYAKSNGDFVCYAGEGNYWVQLTGGTTDANGKVSFTNVQYGSGCHYKLVEWDQPGWTNTQPGYNTEGKAVVEFDMPDANPKSFNFGNVELGKLQVTKSVNWNGVTATAVPFQICIQGPSYPNGNETGACKTFDGSTANPYTQTWSSLKTGSYTVTETNPGSDWTVSYVGSPASVSLGKTAQATVSNTRKLPVVSVHKYNDLNGNGKQDAGEPALGNWEMKLMQGTTVISTVTTDANGWAYFTDVKPGDYTVCETLQANWANTDPGGATACKPVKIDDGVSPTSATAGNNSVTIDMGTNVTNVSLTSHVGNTWTYTVTKTGGQNAISHWVLGLSSCINQGHVVSSTPTADAIGKDGSTGYWGIKWNTSGGIFSFTLDNDYPTGSMNVLVKAGNNYATGTIAGPICGPYFGNQGKGRIIVDKVTVPGGDTTSFPFALTGGPAGLNQTFSLADATTPYDSGLIAAGTGYSVAETAQTGWDLTSATCSDGSPANAISLDAGETVTCTFTNTQRPGSLEVTKSIAWNGATPDAANPSFRICIKGPSYPNGNETGACKTFDGSTATPYTQTWTGLKVGSYQVSENNPGADWTVTSVGSPASVVSDQTAKATVTNTRNVGSLEVTKSLVWNGTAPDATDPSFNICISGPSYPMGTESGACKTFDGSTANPWTQSWTNLKLGTYTVTETNYGANWTVSYSTSSVNVSNGQKFTATVTNTHKLGSLKVIKSVDWNGVTPVSGQSFDICISGPSFSTPNCKTFNGSETPAWTNTWNNLIPGDYTVSEKDEAGSVSAVWTTKVGTTDGLSGSVSVPVSGAEVTVSNTHKLGSLKVIKSVDWNGVTPVTGQSFDICISGPSYTTPDCKTFNGSETPAWTNTWANLLPGDYTVSEKDEAGSVSAVWTTKVGTTDGLSGSVNVPVSGAEVTVSNTHKRGGLTVTKSLDWNGVTPVSGQSFEICISGPSYTTPDCKTFNGSETPAWTNTWSNLIPGDYTVSEKDESGSVSAVWTTKVGVTDGLSGTVTLPADGGSQSITVSNTHKLGSLKVIKSVDWNGVTPVTGQSFDICISGPSFSTPDCKTFNGSETPAWTNTWANLIPGDYTVSEKDEAGSVSAVWTTKVGTTDGLSGSVNVPVSGAEVTVSNTHKRGGLTVTKSLDWNGVTPVSTSFDICLSGPSYTTPDCKTFNGSETPAWTNTWNNLIPGDYTVSEKDESGSVSAVWTTKVGVTDGLSGTVTLPADGGSQSITVSNTHKLGSLKVIKSVDWNGVTPVTGQSFDICISGPSYTTPDCKTFNGSETPAWTNTWANLIPGDYTVSEKDEAGSVSAVWTTKVGTTDGLSGSVNVPVSGAEVTVSNTHKLGSLVVTKSVSWNGVTPVTGQSFDICISGPSFTTPDCKTFNGSETPAWTNTWANLIPGDYTVSEKDEAGSVSSAWTTKVGETDGLSGSVNVPVSGAEVTVSNSHKQGSLTVVKSLNWNGVTPVSASFVICINGPSFDKPDCKTFNGSETPAWTNTWLNLVPGEYTVSEQNDGGSVSSTWTTKVGETDGLSGTVTLPADGGNASITVTNAHRLGDLNITKVVEWNGVTPPAGGQSFTICIQGPSYPAAPTGSETNGACKTTKSFTAGDADPDTLNWTGLVPGDYTVSEPTLSNEWLADFSPNPVTVFIEPEMLSTVVRASAASVTVTNSHKLGSLEITKTVDWMGNNPEQGRSFTICISGPSFPEGTEEGACKVTRIFTENGTDLLTWAELIPGEYTITETGVGAEWKQTITNSPVTVPLDGSKATAGVRNERKLGALEVTKTVVWNGVTPPDGGQSFKICVNGPSFPSGGSCKTTKAFTADGTDVLSWTGLLPGTYTITEPETGEEWQQTIAGSPATITNEGNTATAGVTNARYLGGLDVTKEVNWNGMSPDSEQFEICIQGPSYPNGSEEGACQKTKTFTANGSDILSWKSLIPGAYQVSETADAQARWDVAISSSTITVPVNGTTAADVVTNTRKLGSLEVTKVVDWNGVDPITGKTFEICISGPTYPDPDKNCKTVGYNGGTLEWTNLLPGEYVITETNPGSDWAVTITSSPTVVPASGVKATATVTNINVIIPPTAITLQYFKLVDLNGYDVSLAWKTSAEINNVGYQIYRWNSENPSAAFAAGPVTSMPAKMNATAGAEYSLTDTVPTAGTWYYWLADVDSSGLVTLHTQQSFVVRANVSVEPSASGPKLYLPLIVGGR